MSLPASICLVRDGAVMKSTSTSPLDELKSEERRVETILGNPGEAGKFRRHKDRENASAGWFMLPCLLCLRCFPPEWYKLVNWGLMPQSTLRLRAAPQCRTVAIFARFSTHGTSQRMARKQHFRSQDSGVVGRRSSTQPCGRQANALPNELQ